MYAMFITLEYCYSNTAYLGKQVVFFKHYIGMEQLVACWSHNPKVAGSSPAPETR